MFSETSVDLKIGVLYPLYQEAFSSYNSPHDTEQCNEDIELFYQWFFDKCPRPSARDYYDQLLLEKELSRNELEEHYRAVNQSKPALECP